MKERPVVLVAPLDWGLGHATRCIPIINHLKEMGCEVIIASEGRQLALLQQEFYNIRFVHLKGYRLYYGKSTVETIIKILLQIPKILVAIKGEMKWVSNFLQQNKVNAIISDNRYGLFSKKIPSIIITHQLTIKTPFGNYIDKYVQKLHYRLIEEFSECWVPDYKGNNNLAGELSHPRKMPLLPVKYLGRLSRLHKQDLFPALIELLIILSGPEPQRSILEDILLNQLKTYVYPTVLVRGLPGEKKLMSNNSKNLIIYNHLSSNKLNKIVNDSKFIISRSGYSSIMDLIGLKKNCIFIPTPGQTEQEYLARYLTEKKLCVSYLQHNFSLEQALKEADQCQTAGFDASTDKPYKKVIEDFINETASV